MNDGNCPDSPDFDEGVDLSPTTINPSIGLLSYELDEEKHIPPFLEADTVYILLPKDVPISRAARLQWLLDHLNTVISVPTRVNLDTTSTDLEIISVVPKRKELSYTNKYLITASTNVKYLAYSYRFVYCVDMSPSQSAVDVQRGEILFDEIIRCIKVTVESLILQFTVPGNSLVFQPSLYLTVIVNTPFYMSPAQQVLVEGVKITTKNVLEIIRLIESQFNFLEGRIALVSAIAHDEADLRQAENEGLVGTLFHGNENGQNISNIPVVLPDSNFVNMLRYSMLAISLLPDNSLSHILVITDGVVAMPDNNIMESLLMQLHYDSVSVSFLKVGSPFHPQSSAGYISYTDLLYFLSEATLGSFLEDYPLVRPDPSLTINIYQQLFLLWTFQSKINHNLIATQTKSVLTNEFFDKKLPVLLCKRQTEENINVSVDLLFSRRMREGYHVDKIKYNDNFLHISLTLQWKAFIYIQYHMYYQWPVVKNIVQVEVHIIAPYEFLHDITCIMRKEPKSSFRQAVIERFWLRLSQLSSADTILAQQLSTMQNSNVWYTLPDSVKSGIPVFILNGNDNKLTLTPSDVSCIKFSSLWQPICQIETNNWRKWFHTYKLSVALKYDHPLPKHLHLANSSGRYQVIQCRQAATALYGLLCDWSSFVLIDNHTYLKLIGLEHDKPPSWFCLIRITSKFPCAIVNLAFMTSTPGAIRRKVYEELQVELSLLSYLSSPLKSKENLCCTLLKKPLEKVLIRYEKIPSDFIITVVFPDGTQPSGKLLRCPPPLSGTLFTTLSRYLYHRRWIWSTSHVINPKLELSAVARILSTLTRMRIREGFSFAHSASGIITMVLEVAMDPFSTCLIQYVIFPPHRAWREGEFASGSEEDVDPDTELESEMQMVTEIWVEPQYGAVQLSDCEGHLFNKKRFYELAEVIYRLDSQCISSLLTLEHLSLICQNKSCSSNYEPGKPKHRLSISNRHRRISSQKIGANSVIDKICDVKERIQHVPFNFDPISILPLCQQTELLFSMFIESSASDRVTLTNHFDHERSNKLLLENIHEHLQCLHDYEFDVTSEESERLMNEILSRHRNKSTHTCPISNKVFNTVDCIKWRCYIKGISVTHVILTFVPATLSSLKTLVCGDGTYTPSLNDSSESTERASSRSSNFSDVPINVANSLVLPLYVFDCPLALLVESYVNNTNEDLIVEGDVYEDHRFKNGFHVHEEYIRLKSDDSPDTKADDIDADTKHNVRSHCKALVLTHSKCFVMSLFSTLQNGCYVHSSDVHYAMDQCEESVYDIDISYYMKTICGHMKEDGENISVDTLHQPLMCNELKPLHHLIKDRFSDIMNMAFSSIPNNKDFYYCQNLTMEKSTMKGDSDDEISIPPSDGVEFKSDKEASSSSEITSNFMRLDSTNSLFQNSTIAPLFVHLICTVRYNNNVANTSVKVLPTCLGELIQSIESDLEYLDKSNLQITLDILCLTLPLTVQNVITDYSSKGMRTTSFCSDAFPPSVDSVTSDASFAAEFSDPLVHLPEIQKKAISNLKDKIKWLLKDEIATALLDVDLVTSDTLNFVISHVSDNVGCSSCVLDTIDLSFVFGSVHSYDKFVQEFARIKIPYYKLCKERDIYYLTKDEPYGVSQVEKFVITELISENFLIDLCIDGVEKVNSTDSLSDKSEGMDLDDNSIRNEAFSQQSDVSSANESYFGTDGGYDEDISEDEEDYNWLIRLEKKRQNLPNFWLIMCVDKESVTIYFHCRFLELPTTHVGTYLQVQRTVRDAIQDLCKRVNQSLLLQALNDTRTCDFLLEPDDDYKDWHSSVKPTLTGNSSFSRLKSMDEASDEFDPYSVASMEASLKFTAGFFSCPVVWETQFVLHPRLKTGFGKSGFSRGVLALKTVLDKFSVSNRSNMFVYQDVKSNVFYLRLHENVQNFGKTTARSSEFESTVVSRSPSIASLPLGPQKNTLTQSQHSIASSNSRESEVRPRVRSFGEKETKETLIEDTLILRVHGITEAGDDVRCDLVQVLQNRLDDAVLECLSIMLARNAMCPLTPEDVHFLQKPFKLPENIIKLSVQPYALKYINSFIHYLKQNLLQFLNIPKYTDNRPHYHFKDYSETEQSTKVQDNIFIYNQSQNPSSGSKGIVCIALAIIDGLDGNTASEFDGNFAELLQSLTYNELVYTQRFTESDKPQTTYVEFRLWKQGRVNTDNLTDKLCAATKQSMWDIVTEYYLLQSPLCEKDLEDRSSTNPITQRQPTNPVLTEKEVECSVILNTNIVTNFKDRRKLQAKQTKTNETPKVLISQRHKKYIPLNSNARRSILFEDYFENDQNKSDEKKKLLIKFDGYELGNEGVLTSICSTVLHKWLDFGVELLVPSVRKNIVLLSSPHMLSTIVQEFKNSVTHMSHDPAKAFTLLPSDDADEEIYVPYNTMQLPSKVIIVSRNFEQWKACMMSASVQDYCEVVNPQNLKHTQKFTPSIVEEFGFVPRQKFLWTFIESTKITLYTYNWSKDNVNKLIDLGNNLGLWLSVRAAVLNSITAQKLGIFYNQPLTRSNLNAKNPYLNYIGDVEFMMKFSKDHARRIPTAAIIQPMVTLEAFWDVYPSMPSYHTDPVVLFTLEMQEMKRNDKKHKDELKKLHSMWQSRTSTCTSTQIQILKQNSRVTHFCHTPLLFLPCWRVQSASTRDHALSPSIICSTNSTIDGRRPSKTDENIWHNGLCQAFITEYKRYLQTLGFIPLQIENSHKKRGVFVKLENSTPDSVFYVQKAMLGGILIFSIYLKEPFFITKLHAIECHRLQSNNSRLAKNQFTLNFLDELDKIRMVMHLHSFTYDFHLRCIRNYVANSSGERVSEGYHLTHFLDDFMKYYNKAPNFARNLVHEETFTINDLTTEGKQLYDYLLSNVNQYGMDVYSMQGDDGECTEYVLVQMESIPQMSYKDSQDFQHTDDFDVTLVLSRVSSEADSNVTLHLKYYLILTSRREVFPKAEGDRKLGKFRKVSCAMRSTLTSRKESRVEDDSTSSITESHPSESEVELESSTDQSLEAQSDTNSQQLETAASSRKSSILPNPLHIEIKQESVNYLGYYSSHERLMQQLILEQAAITRDKIREIVSQGMVDCRTHLLWNKLVSPPEANHLTYGEFLELKNLAKLEYLSDTHSNLSSLLHQPLTWYQGLAKLLLVKYADQNRTFISPDGNIQHYVILHHRYDGAFMLLSMDLHTSRGDLYAVYRASHKYDDSDICLMDCKALLDGFINCVCFYIWSGLL